jgi:hypothetical protein
MAPTMTRIKDADIVLPDGKHCTVAHEVAYWADYFAESAKRAPEQPGPNLETRGFMEPDPNSIAHYKLPNGKLSMNAPKKDLAAFAKRLRKIAKKLLEGKTRDLYGEYK